jgi:rsbT co-antagonist protein RsbR
MSGNGNGAANETSVAKLQAMVSVLFEENPDGVTIADTAGNITSNRRTIELFGEVDAEVPPEQWAERYGLFHEDRVTPFALQDMPLFRALRGETIDELLLYRKGPEMKQGVFLSISARPLVGGGAIAVYRDVTEQRRLSDDVTQRNAELAQREEENRELIRRLRGAVDELSTPVLEIWNDVLALPVVGLVDTQRSARMTDRVLTEVVRTRARSVIVDLTGVELIDTSTADRFIKLARSVQLLGARCLVTGIQPAVAQTLVELGVEFAALETHRNLKSALEATIRRDAFERRSQTDR